jgi:hypothetical protein
MQESIAAFASLRQELIDAQRQALLRSSQSN